VKIGISTAQRIVRDGFDVVSWANNPLEVLKGCVPSRWIKRMVLNEQPCFRPSCATPEVLGESLQMMRHLLTSDAIVDGLVDYRALHTSKLYGEFAQRTLALRHVYPVAFDSDAERVAFWLNLYNALCIHAVIALGLRESAMEMPSVFARVAYRVGEWTFTPDDILNGVLRRGRRRPNGSRRQFGERDPRLAYCASHVDPRIHGALVCLARSCPPVAFYSAAKLEQQLDLAAGHLIAGSVEVDAERRRLQLPLQLYYYAEDFGERARVEGYVLRHLPGALRELVERAFREHWQIDWQPYDWALNSIGQPLEVTDSAVLSDSVSAYPR
jgi:hypothetical protein